MPILYCISQTINLKYHEWKKRLFNIIFTVVNIDKLTYRLIRNHANRVNNLQKISWVSIFPAMNVLKLLENSVYESNFKNINILTR